MFQKSFPASKQIRRAKFNQEPALKHKYIEVSVLDHNGMRRAMGGVDFVFHLAAMGGVPEFMRNPIECVEINTAGTLIVLEEAGHAKGRRLY